jgi:hypothetical protein
MAGHIWGVAKKHWNGEPDEILLVELHRAGSLPQARIRGVQSGIGEVLRVPERCRIVSVDATAVPDYAGARAQASAGIEGQRACWLGGKRFERARRLRAFEEAAARANV